MKRLGKSSPCIIILVILLYATAFAEQTINWKIPHNVRIVQKSTKPDGVRTFNSIQAALNSITNASPTNRHIVKIMPGIYSEPFQIQMKPFVDIIGASLNSSIILTENLLGHGIAPILGAENTLLKDLTIIGDTANYPGRCLEGNSIIIDSVIADCMVLISDSTVKNSIIGRISASNSFLINSQLKYIYDASRKKIINCYDSSFNPIYNQ